MGTLCRRTLRNGARSLFSSIVYVFQPLNRRSIAPYEHRRAWKRRRLKPLNAAAFLLPPSSLHRRSIAPYEHRRAWKRRRLKPLTFKNSRSDIEGRGNIVDDGGCGNTSSHGTFNMLLYFLKKEPVVMKNDDAEKGNFEEAMEIKSPPFLLFEKEQLIYGHVKSVVGQVVKKIVEREERKKGLLPPAVFSHDLQEKWLMKILRDYEVPRQRYMAMMDLQERNEKLFYKLLINNVEQLLPVVYTPTVGEACQKYGSIFRRPSADRFLASAVVSNSQLQNVTCTLVFHRRKCWNITYGSSSNPRKRNSPGTEDPGKKRGGIKRNRTGQSLKVTFSERNRGPSPADQESEEVHVEDRSDGINVHNWHLVPSLLLGAIMQQQLQPP